MVKDLHYAGVSQVSAIFSIMDLLANAPVICNHTRGKGGG